MPVQQGETQSRDVQQCMLQEQATPQHATHPDVLDGEPEPVMGQAEIPQPDLQPAEIGQAAIPQPEMQQG